LASQAGAIQPHFFAQKGPEKAAVSTGAKKNDGCCRVDCVTDLIVLVATGAKALRRPLRPTKVHEKVGLHWVTALRNLLDAPDSWCGNIRRITSTVFIHGVRT
jgi:hypothetical protein